jgi:hypothetical protein
MDTLREGLDAFLCVQHIWIFCRHGNHLRLFSVSCCVSCIKGILRGRNTIDYNPIIKMLNIRVILFSSHYMFPSIKIIIRWYFVSTQYIYVFHTIFWMDGDHFPKQHYLVDLWYGDMCFLWGTDCVCIFGLTSFSHYSYRDLRLKPGNRVAKRCSLYLTPFLRSEVYLSHDFPLPSTLLPCFILVCVSYFMLPRVNSLIAMVYYNWRPLYSCKTQYTRRSCEV